MLSGGLGSSPLFAVPETTTDADGLLPEVSIAPIREWLEDVSTDQRTRSKVVLQTLDGALVSVCRAAPGVATAIDEQVDALQQLRSDVDKSYAEAARAVSVQTADGTMLRGEVLARWHDLVGTGEFFRVVEQKIGWVRDRLWGALKGEPKQAGEVKVAVESGLETLVRAEADAAAERAESAWRSHPAGRELVASHPELGAASTDFGEVAARIVREWQGGVIALVSEEGKGKRVQARFLALGVNGVGVALMILVFSQTGGLVGAEIGIAGGTAVVAQRLLEAVFGEDAVRRLATRAKEDLDARVDGAMAEELVRYHKVLDSAGVAGSAADAIRDAVEGVLHARSSSWAEVVGELPARFEPVSLPPAKTSDPAALGRGTSGGAAASASDILDAEIVEDES
jgi:hypothetical protein